MFRLQTALIKSNGSLCWNWNLPSFLLEEINVILLLCIHYDYVKLIRWEEKVNFVKSKINILFFLKNLTKIPFTF